MPIIDFRPYRDANLYNPPTPPPMDDPPSTLPFIAEEDDEDEEDLDCPRELTTPIHPPTDSLQPGLTIEPSTPPVPPLLPQSLGFQALKKIKLKFQSLFK
jgi:hypothetical protein